MEHTATYSPDDNKCRFYPAHRLDPEEYKRVRAAGFIWAPKQELFVAPAWTPEREDFLLEMCGEIGDEDKSLVERAEERAERFEDYSEKRAEDADNARERATVLANGIPFGQPILVGHHSEKHARKDAERIENGMRKAVKMWETSKYWKSRASGAIHAAKYKERPDVRARRIKGLEADKRKQEKARDESALKLKLWTKIHDPESIKKKDGTPSTFKERALYVANLGCGSYGIWSDLNTDKITPEEAQERAIKSHTGTIAWCERWINHYENRLAYERALLANDGGTVADRTGPEKDGACKCWASPRNGWSYIVKVNKVSVTVEDNWGNGGANFTRTIPFDKLSSIMTAAQVQEKRDTGQLIELVNRVGFALRDAPLSETVQATETHDEKNERLHREHMKTLPKDSGNDADFQNMRETLKQGIHVISAPQLFPTPPDLARRMVELAEIAPGQRILEPSAGTGNLLRRLIGLDVDVVAVEINHNMAEMLRVQYPGENNIKCADFLSCNGELGTFDRIVMNPPFINGEDIKHIQHARKFLKPGGKIVALCANGPRQREALRPIASYWQDLPEGSFKESGTNVNVAMVVIER